jgi:RNA polymerase sigma-70 factor (ECF subfamily)
VEDTGQTPEIIGTSSTIPVPSSLAADDADRRLLAAAAQGDNGAFAALYRNHSTAIFNYLLRLVHDKNQAEDLLQETFMATWRGANTFRRQSSVRTWLFSIAHNKAVSWLRRNRPQSMDEDLEITDDSPGPEMLSQITWRNEAILSAMDELSVSHRAVVELAFVHELAYADIAQIMGCPLGTVKSRMSYALTHLQRLLIDLETD